MTHRGPALLILALALAFVGLVLLRSGVRIPASPAHAPAAADTLPAPPRDVSWIGGAPPVRAPITAVVIWELADPGSLGAADRAEEWRLLDAPLGVRVIGVYAPHAAFDTDSAVVAAEMKRRGLGYPVALDVSLGWTHALSHSGARPRVVLADSLGRMTWSGRDTHAAERELERMVTERRPDLAPPPGTVANGRVANGTVGSGSTAESVSAHPQSPVIPSTRTDDPAVEDHAAAHAPVWLGAGDHPAGPLADVTPGGPRIFHAELASEIAGKRWVPTPIGRWTLGADGLTAARGGAEEYVALRYDACPLAVLATGAGRSLTRLWVLLDGAWVPGDLAGADLRYDGHGASYVEVTWPRLYDVVRADGHMHVVKLSPEDPELALHAFVFEAVPPVTAQP
jgi:hypothetical protein